MHDIFRAFTPTSLPSDAHTAALLGLQADIPEWLQNKIQLSIIYAALCASRHPVTHTTVMDAATRQATYLQGLSKAHALQEQPAAARTLHQQQRNARALADWLPSTNIGRTPYPLPP